MNDQFEGPEIYEDLSIDTKIFPTLSFVVTGALDINSFQIETSDFLSSANSKIIQISNNTIFLTDISHQESKQILKNIKILNYQIYSIFLKTTLLNNLLEKATFLNRNLYYVYFEEKYPFFLFENSNKIQDSKIIKSIPIKHFYGFNKFIDLMSFYIEIIQSKNWPIFVILPKINNAKKETKSQDNNLGYNYFSPLKSLFYFSFIQKVPPSSERKINVDEIYTVKRVQDVQISHLKNSTICTFLGFDNKFKCMYNFDYFNRQKLTISKTIGNEINDIQLIDVETDDRINSDFYYLELFYFFDATVEYSMNCIDVFNFKHSDKISTVYCFNNSDDFAEVMAYFKKSMRDTWLKNIKIMEKKDFNTLFRTERSIDSTAYFITFRMKDAKKVADLKQLISFDFVIENAVCILDNKKYIAAGFYDVEQRNKAFNALLNSNYSRRVKFYYPRSFISPLIEDQSQNNSANNSKDQSQNNSKENVQHVEMKMPQFRPKTGLYYFYFEEYEKSKSKFPSNHIRPVFGVKNMSDLQKNYFLPDSPNEYTFIGFTDEQLMEQAIKSSPSLITNAINGKIYRYKNKQNDLVTMYQFVPKKGMFYIYFEEHDGGKPRNPTKVVSPLFGIRNISDLQRNYRLPDSPIEYTFVGFSSKEEMEKVYNEAVHGRNMLFTNTKDGKIFKYRNETDANINNSNTNIDRNANSNQNEDLRNFQEICLSKTGKFAKVILAEDKTSHKKYAAKVFNSSLGTNEEKTKFNDLLKHYSKISNPSIIRIHAYSCNDFQNKPFPTIIFDYMSNGSLEDLLNKSRQSTEFSESIKTKKFIILLGITLAMKYIHSQKIINRDLNPSNVLLDENYYPKICDFGLSFISDSDLLTYQKDKDEIAPYLDPEIVLKDLPYSFGSDVYAFSFIAYELITGEKAFKDYYSSKIKLWKDADKGIRPNLNIIPDPEIRLLLQRCWSRSSKERPSFDEIYQIIAKSNLRFYLGINESELMNYLDYYNKSQNYEKISIDSLESISQKAAKGNIESMATYGMMLVSGLGIPKDVNKGLQYLIKSFKNGSVEGTYYLANYLSGLSDEQSQKKANGLLQIAANKGHVQAMVDFGDRLMSGKGCSVNLQLAINYFLKASEHENADSLYKCASMVEKGIGFKVDKKAAFKYFQLSADLGNVNAMYEVARMCRQGDGIEINISMAEDCFRMASFQGNKEAMIGLSVMYLDGSVPINPNEAHFWLMKFINETNNKTLLSCVSDAFKANEDGTFNISKLNKLAQTLKKDFFSKEEIKQKAKTTKIDKVIVKFYQTFSVDKIIMSYNVPNSIPEPIRKKINTIAHRFKIKFKQNVFYGYDLNDLQTIYIFPDENMHLYFMQNVCSIIKENKYLIASPKTDYLYFDEKMFPREGLSFFLDFLSKNKSQVLEIRRNVFINSKIFTCLAVPVPNQVSFVKKIRSALLAKDLIFNSEKYPLVNDIVIKEKIVLNNSSDFDIIVDEIKSIREDIIINIERNKLYLYNKHPYRYLFQLCSFICFKDQVDKMTALNHINKIVCKRNKNVLNCNVNYYYASANTSLYPSIFREYFLENLRCLKGIVDIQENVLSIESPVEKTYFGFDTMNHLKKGYAKLSHRLNVIISAPNAKLFNKNKNLVYMVIVRLKNFKYNLAEVIGLISDMAADIQMDCTEIIQGNAIDASFIGFSSIDYLKEAIDLLESYPNIKNSLLISRYQEGKTFMYKNSEYEEEYLFNNAF